MSGVPLRRQRTAVALAAVAVILGVAYLLVPNQVVQYGAWLLVFSVWMTWFVFTAVEWISNANF